MSRRRVVFSCWFTLVVAGVTALAAPGVATTPASPPDPRRDRLEMLRREIAEHDDRYHRQAAPIVSDFEYDELKRAFHELERALGERAADPADEPVPDDRSAQGRRWRHRAPMLSLFKAHSAADVAAFHSRVGRRLGREEVRYVIEPKIDGVAVSVTYLDGRLVAAATRGDGAEGEDITAHVTALGILPARLPSHPAGPVDRGSGVPTLVEVRGELFLPWAAFHRLNSEQERVGEPGFGHPRTVAAATVKRHDSELTAERGLELVFYGLGAIEPAELRPATQRELHDWLHALGLPVLPEVRTASGLAELNAVIAQLEPARTVYPFPSDGFVIKVDEVAEQAALGESRNAPRWALARKFEPERVTTRLRAIVWQVGRTGALSPVAAFDPVELGGSTVRRASLHNAEEIVRRDLRIGDAIIVEKAGEIIPAVVGVDRARRSPASMPYELPTACPACGSALPDRSGVAEWRCVAEDCAERLRRQLEHYVSAAGVGIEGLGPAILTGLIERGRLRSIADLYRLRRDDLPPTQAERLLSAIDRSRDADLARILQGLGLPGIGRAAATAVAARFASLPELLAATLDDLAPGPGLGAVSAQALQAHLTDPSIRRLMTELATLGVGSGGSAERYPRANEAAVRVFDLPSK